MTTNKTSIAVDRTMNPVPAKGQTAGPTEVDEITPQLVGLKFPVTSREDLLSRVVKGHKYFYRGKEVTVNTMIAKMPAEFFPITSQADFTAKIGKNIKAQPVRNIDPVIKIINHPTTVNPPGGAKPT